MNNEFEVFGAGRVSFGVVLEGVDEGFGEADGVVAGVEMVRLNGLAWNGSVGGRKLRCEDVLGFCGFGGSGTHCDLWG